MNVLKNSTEFISRLGQWARPKTPAERRAADVTATVIALIAAALLLYTWFN